MEKLTIGLDCNKKICGNCRFVIWTSGGTICGLYVKVLDDVKGYDFLNYHRLPECIAACKAQRGSVFGKNYSEPKCWIRHYANPVGVYYTCPECTTVPFIVNCPSNYCPHCGTKLDKPED